MYRKYDAVTIPKIPSNILFGWLTQRRDVWFLKVGDVGLIWFTGVPSRVADMNYLFWDLKLGADRREILKAAIVTAFKLFQLERLSLAVPERNQPMRKTALQYLGFTYEGRIRKGWTLEEDLFIYGMLKDEQPCLAVPLPKIISG